MESTEFMGQTSVHLQSSELKSYLTEMRKRFPVLMDLTGVDYLEPQPHTEVIYFLHQPETMERLRVTVDVGRGESIPSVTDLWAGADWYERELYDLFGILFTNHPDLKRILMPDDWRGHPLRRDYALTEEPVEFKHGVKVKIPSEIIPNVRTKWTYDKQ